MLLLMDSNAASERMAEDLKSPLLSIDKSEVYITNVLRPIEML